RKEFLPRFRLAGGNCCDQNDGFPQLNCDGAVRLFSQFAGFDVNLIGSELSRYFFCHNNFPLSLPAPRNFSELSCSGRLTEITQCQQGPFHTRCVVVEVRIEAVAPRFNKKKTGLNSPKALEDQTKPFYLRSFSFLVTD